MKSRNLLTPEAPETEQGSGLPPLWVTSWSSGSLRGFVPGPTWRGGAELRLVTRGKAIFLVATALACIPICGRTPVSCLTLLGHTLKSSLDVGF